ncbi:DUF2125 domain-containing protein [Paracoccus salsus]|uniref:DUF2125 domain-containing protein n=1 Tax=Paracoccus salsus TaxID=2911061 RepID=UPI001F46BBEE|nr:DUF2125 domain-containing protein [Paracoccus salsus]MCF3974370.1 hypothetical protein [Paracoccus salsus]
MFRPLATSATALIAAASPVLAEVTPAQVWEDLSAYYTDMGYEIATGSRAEAGDTLTLSDIVISTDSETGELSIRVPGIVLRATGDARVRTVIDGPITTDISARIPDQDDMVTQMIVSLPDNEMLSSGSPDDMLHEVVYPDLLVSARFDGEDGSVSAEHMPLHVRMTDVTGRYRSVSGPAAVSTYDMTAKKLDLTLDLKELETADDGGETGSFTARSIVEQLTVTGSVTAPDGQFDMADNMHGALKAGLEIDGKVAIGPLTGSAQFSGTDAEGGQTSGETSFSSDSSQFGLALSRDGLSFQGSASEMKAEMTTSDLPLPISYAVETASGLMTIPVSQSEQPQPFRFGYARDGLTLADGLWDLFDPNGQLPRDPASLTIDVEGTATLTDDLLDPAFADRMEQAARQRDEADTQAADGEAAPSGADRPQMPFRPETLKINQVTLDAAGVNADLSGALTMREGADQPVGRIEGNFDGVNTLLDTLVSMGVLPKEQMMAARMMLAMFARPVEDNPGQLRSEIEFREDGSIYANGQQVK